MDEIMVKARFLEGLADAVSEWLAKNPPSNEEGMVRTDDALSYYMSTIGTLLQAAATVTKNASSCLGMVMSEEQFVKLARERFRDVQEATQDPAGPLK